MLDVRPLKSAGRFIHKSAPLAPLLQVLGPVIRGFQAPLQEAGAVTLGHDHVVGAAPATGRAAPPVVRLMTRRKGICLRHKPNEWLLWDRQQPLISMYHKEP